MSRLDSYHLIGHTQKVRVDQTHRGLCKPARTAMTHQKNDSERGIPREGVLDQKEGHI